MMRRTIIVLPNLLGAVRDDSPLIQKLPSLQALTELGEIKRLAPVPKIETPEAMWLGLAPEKAQMHQGPLTVAALGQDPPERSTHFHVSLMGFHDGMAMELPPAIPAKELQEVLLQANKLNTKKLTFLEGENKDHALVWEDLGDLQTFSGADVSGRPMKEHLPQGDGEGELRRFIDDSVNLLSDLELNERRIDAGLPPLNLLWPWGHGRRMPVPNLLLKRGERAHVESNSLRLAGLARLVGYKHGDRGAFGRGTNTRLAKQADFALNADLTIIVIDAPSEMREQNLQEELHWFIHELDSQFLAPLFEKAVTEPSRLSVIAPSENLGLSLDFVTGMHGNNPYPFDERSTEEKSVALIEAWDAIDHALRPMSIAASRTE